ncbi:MAG: Ca-activated chloride channel [Acidobacteriota bacterium]|jgi:VWFA-related protein|nr:Ca-activated chloride channel [Acidobacteriota bacterium]
MKVMLRLQQAKFLSAILAALLLLLLAPQAKSILFIDEGVRADLPLGGRLRVENRRGSVSIEVWNEKYVSITATVEGKTPNRSPVIIERTEQLLTIGVVNQTAVTPARVDLILRIPERSRAEIITTSGEITIGGVPEELTAKTVSANIRAEFSASGNVDLQADAPNGKITHTLLSLVDLSNVIPSNENRHSLHLHQGTGSKSLRLRSERGNITLMPNIDITDTAQASETRKLPVLIGADKNSPGAGTPSAPLTSPEEVSEGDVVRVDTELVTLNVSVVDRGTNRGLKGLAQSDFKLFEDGAQQQIAHFESASAPFNLILLIDLSTSTQEKIGLVREAALRFVNAARPADRIGIITFANKFVVVSPPTSDREELRARINAIQQPKGSTKLYDALAYAMDEATKNAKDSRRNAIILMSDGLDSTLPNVSGEGSKTTYDEVLSQVREFDGVLYTLWLDTSYEPLSVLDIQDETFDLAYDRMKELAEAGGGIFYEVEKLEDLADAYERVVADLGTVYSLSYRPTNKGRDGKWRAIRVAVARPNAVARGKRGYYAN